MRMKDEVQTLFNVTKENVENSVSIDWSYTVFWKYNSARILVQTCMLIICSLFIYTYIYTHTHTHTHRVFRNNCRDFNNLSYTTHLRHVFLFNRTTLQIFVTYLTGALCVHPLWFYRVIRSDCRGFNNLSYTIHFR